MKKKFVQQKLVQEKLSELMGEITVYEVLPPNSQVIMLLIRYMNHHGLGIGVRQVVLAA